MASQKQIDANRKNAKKSTGPKTVEGKAKAMRNSLKHGLTGAGVVMPVEREAVTERLYHEMIATMNVPHVAQKFLVKRLAIEAARMMGATTARELTEQWVAQNEMNALNFRDYAYRNDKATNDARRRLKRLDHFYEIADQPPMFDDEELDDFLEQVDRGGFDRPAVRLSIQEAREADDHELFARLVRDEIKLTRRSHKATMVDAEPHARLHEVIHVGAICYLENKCAQLLCDYENRSLSRYQSIYATLEKSGAFKITQNDPTKMKTQDSSKKSSSIPDLTVEQVLPPALKKRLEKAPSFADFHKLELNSAGYLWIPGQDPYIR